MPCVLYSSSYNEWTVLQETQYWIVIAARDTHRNRFTPAFNSDIRPVPHLSPIQCEKRYSRKLVASLAYCSREIHTRVRVDRPFRWVHSRSDFYFEEKRLHFTLVNYQWLSTFSIIAGKHKNSPSSSSGMCVRQLDHACSRWHVDLLRLRLFTLDAQ